MTTNTNIRFEDWEAEQMKDPEFRVAVEELEPECQAARMEYSNYMSGDKKDFEIVSFLAGKTIKAVKGSWFTGGIELIFTDGSRIKIRPYTEHECGYIGYSMKSAPDDSKGYHGPGQCSERKK